MCCLSVKKVCLASLQTPTPFIYLNPSGLNDEEQSVPWTWLKEHGRQGLHDLHTNQFQFCLAARYIQLNLNFEAQGWVPKFHPELSIPQFTFTLGHLLKYRLRVRFPFLTSANFLPKCVWHLPVLHPQCLNSCFAVVCLFDNANMLSFVFFLIYVQSLLSSRSFCLFVCLSKQISLSLPYPRILRLFTSVVWIRRIAKRHDRAYSSLFTRSNLSRTFCMNCEYLRGYDMF